MAIFAPHIGEEQYLKIMVGQELATDDVTLHLYVNDVTPARDDDLSDYTELSMLLYTPLTINSADWTVDTVADQSYAITDESSIEITGECEVFGYYVTDANNNLLYVEAFEDGSVTFPTAGGFLAITPRIQLI